VIVFHVAMDPAPDYVARREPHRQAHLERLFGLRSRGFCLGGGPSPDGTAVDIFYRTEQPADLAALVEDDPYFRGGAWTGYRPRSFSRFLEPWQLGPVVVDGSRRATIVEGSTPDPEMASFALIEARGAGRMVLGGLFADGNTLAVMTTSDPEEALAPLRECGFWAADTLRARPFLHVL